MKQKLKSALSPLTNRSFNSLMIILFSVYVVGDLLTTFIVINETSVNAEANPVVAVMYENFGMGYLLPVKFGTFMLLIILAISWNRKDPVKTKYILTGYILFWASVTGINLFNISVIHLYKAGLI